ncbi:unnamed protein product [Echinostoma caproni]|uniref:ABC transmembrane type-1 domain-containing protein n=1 Tax=Echinostoma caproni TaxID=27848 RepID=A0A183AUW1_9TREM|nr:unnamed protein product [Echinostoma caproni]
MKLLPILSKVMEAIVADLWIEYLEKHELFSPTQHGIWHKLSCTTNLILVRDEWTKSVNLGVVLVVLYVGGHLLSRNEINPGELMSFLATTQTVQRSLAQLSLLYGQVLRGSVAFTRIQEVITADRTEIVLCFMCVLMFLFSVIPILILNAFGSKQNVICPLDSCVTLCHFTQLLLEVCVCTCVFTYAACRFIDRSLNINTV